MKENCNNIFDDVYYNEETKLIKYNNLCEKKDLPKNNKKCCV